MLVNCTETIGRSGPGPIARAALFAATAAFAFPALAQTMSVESSLPRGTGKDPNRKICERVEKIGSRLATTTVCRTAAEWEELSSGQREDFERLQRLGNTPLWPGEEP